MRGGAGGGANSFGAESFGGARPQTAEIIKTFGQRCPEVIVNNQPDIANYIVELDHEGGKGLLRHKDKVAVFERLSGDNVMSRSTLSVGGSVKDACAGIIQDWGIHGKDILAAVKKSTLQMPSVNPVSPPAAVQATLAIDSTPAGADIEIDGAFVGNTPSTVNASAGSHEVVVKKKGFTDWSRKLNVTGGSIHLSADLEPLPQK